MSNRKLSRSNPIQNYLKKKEKCNNPAQTKKNKDKITKPIKTIITLRKLGKT